MLRDDLLDSALRTLNRNPAASMADIAEDAGISRATLNRHVASRDSLIRELGERNLDSWDASIDASGIEQVIADGGGADAIREALRGLLRAYVADTETYGFALTNPGLEQTADLAARVEVLNRREWAVFAAAQEAGVLRRDVTPQWIAWSIFGLLVGARDGLRFGDLPRRGLEEVLISTFLEGNGS